MDFLKKNYEKVLLALVLLGLTTAVALLPIIISQKKQNLDAIRLTKTNTPPKPLPPVNKAPFDAALQRAQTPVKLDFTTKHNLLNPVLWQTMPNGTLLKVETGTEIGAGALKVTAIKPLYLRVNFEGSDPSGYIIKVTDERTRRPTTRTTIVSLENKTGFLLLTKVGGAPERPELDLQVKDTGEAFTITAEKPYSRVTAHTADLQYTADSTPPMTDKREGDSIRFGGGDYYIIEISANSVVIVDKSTSKKTPIPFNK